MSINSITAPYPVFTDVDGDPLESGYIYIGEPNLNPKVNTKQAYFDRDLSIPASQPIRTVGGYPSYNGSPAVLYVDGDYSITVENKNQAFIYTAAVATNILGSLNSYDSISELIGYETAPENTSVNVTGYYAANDGGGGIFNWSSTTDKSTANSGTIIDPSVSLENQGTGVGNGCWVRQYDGAVNVKWFGAKGDGIADDTAAIQAAINMTNAAYVPSGTYVVSSTLTLQSNTVIKSESYINTIFDFDGLFASSNFLVYGASTDNVTIEGITIDGGLTAFNNDGQDKYGIYISNSSNCSIKKCKVTGTERGIIFGVGTTDSTISECIAIDNWYAGFGTYATSTNPARRVNIINNVAYMSSIQSPLVDYCQTGINFEETYDSAVRGNKCFHCSQGIRIENSCDNEVSYNVCYENKTSGISLYNSAQRNSVSGNSCFDNNTDNHNDVLIDDGDNKGNADTNCSGINVENNSDSNIIIGNKCFVTETNLNGNQKFGIGINIRNLTGISSQDSYNIVTNNFCVNNEVFNIEDRGAYNDISHNMENYYNLTRN